MVERFLITRGKSIISQIRKSREPVLELLNGTQYKIDVKKRVVDLYDFGQMASELILI